MSILRKIITTHPTVGDPTVTSGYLFNNSKDHGLEIRIESDQAGTVTIRHSADGVTASRTETYDINTLEWKNVSALYDLYVSVDFTLTSGVDNTRFTLEVYAGDTLPESLISIPVANVNIVGTPAVTVSGITLDNADSNILIYGAALNGSGNLPVGTNEFGCVCTTSNCITVSLPDAYTNVQEVERSCTGGYISHASMPYMFDGTSWNRQRGSIANGLNVYDASTISKLDDVNANLNVINTTLAGPLDVSAQTVTTQDLTSHTRLADINANVVVNGDRLLTLDTDLINIDNSIDSLNTDTNANLALINNALSGTLTVTDPGINSNIVLLGQTVYDIESNVRVNGGKLDTINATLTKNLTSAYITNLANTSQLIYTGACTLHLVSYTHNHSSAGVLCIYDASGAVTGADPPKFVVYMNGGTTDTLPFPVNGMSFTNGIAVRGVTGTSQTGSGNLNSLVTSTILYDPA